MRSISDQEQAGMVMLVCMLGAGAMVAIGFLIRAIGA
jgi:hypothetical protein